MLIKTKWISLGLSLAFSFALSGFASAQDFQTQSIYGKDNRQDYFEVPSSPLKRASESTVALFDSTSIYHYGSTQQVYLPTLSLKYSHNVCETERFRDQPTGAFCSGFLVSENLVITAGHCIETQEECLGTRLVFGYRLNSALVGGRVVPESEVYSCKTLIHREQSVFGEDWALIKLDRDVSNHSPLALQKTPVLSGSLVAAVGHPSGLPLKITTDGKVRENYRGKFFTASLDTFGGNSGSAVFNQSTGQVVGILVRGAKDYVLDRDKGCNVSKTYGEGGIFGGEAVTRVSAFLPTLEAAKAQNYR
jgi:V8-like Glu-specific endopeptidase